MRSLELADENLVIAMLQGKLPKLGADATEDALATECVGYVLLKLLVFGMGGSDWTISGDALLVDQRDGAKGDSQGDKSKEPRPEGRGSLLTDVAAWLPRFTPTVKRGR